MNAITLLLYYIRFNCLLVAPGPGTTSRCAAATAAATTASVKGLRIATTLTTARFTATVRFATSAAD
jgi:hypothetical protein